MDRGWFVVFQIPVPFHASLASRAKVVLLNSDAFVVNVVRLISLFSLLVFL